MKKLESFSGRGEVEGAVSLGWFGSLLPPLLASAAETGFPGFATVAVGLTQDRVLPAQMHVCVRSAQ